MTDSDQKEKLGIRLILKSVSIIAILLIFGRIILEESPFKEDLSGYILYDKSKI